MRLPVQQTSDNDLVARPRAKYGARLGRLVPLQTPSIPDESTLAAFALALGAGRVGRLSREEEALPRVAHADPRAVKAFEERIRSGEDPLGTAFVEMRSAEERRNLGAVYTPSPIVHAMLSWAEEVGEPDRVVDPGAGSGRFLLEAGRRFPSAHLLAVEVDPLAALVTRANLAAAGFERRADVSVEDFRSSPIEGFEGRTLFIGNPPYVRHHLLGPDWKQWLKRQAGALGLDASALAGLHVYFFLAVACRAREGDYGAFITAAEWLDVNYGQLVRDLFLERLGGQAVVVIEPKAEPFPGTATTGAVTLFRIGSRPPSARFTRTADLATLGSLQAGRRVGRDRLAAEVRWSRFTRAPMAIPEGYAELGDLCRVHRGQVTGANKIWIAGPHSDGLPASVLFPAVTKALELFRAGPALCDDRELRQVIDLPADLSALDSQELAAIQHFLDRAKQMGGDSGYVATHRRAWWSVGLRQPAPILATYMARRAPAFVLNQAAAHHLNIAHGLYPREPFDQSLLEKLVLFLRQSTTTHGGREYSGGLTKFEPREMERIRVPEPTLLREMPL